MGERRSAEYITHAPLGSLNSVGGVATEINAVNFVSPRSWLACSHFCLGFFSLSDIFGIEVELELLPQGLKKELIAKMNRYYLYVHWIKIYNIILLKREKKKKKKKNFEFLKKKKKKKKKS